MSSNPSHSVNHPLPQHIKKEWLKILARLQSVRGKHPLHPAIYKLTILVDSNGLPQFFTRPSVIVLEPGRVDALGRLKDILSSDKCTDEERLNQITEVLELIL